ncbi:MAG: LysM peptidoglycan-binding domain-containing protein [Spirochaetaceae bacterium]|jgi:prophage tail gpP-like protein|nr:LysM peptidoglycan-binding domain-containing protein [Spirochaetaceae bacterium]
MADRKTTGDILTIPQQGAAYVVKQGDYLRNIALRAYGNEMEWPRIRDANPAITNPDLIYPGMVILIPVKPPPSPPPAPSADSITEPAGALAAVKKQRSINLRLPNGAPIIKAVVTLGDEDKELDCITGQFSYGLDTFAPAWIVTVPWTPGNDKYFDKNTAAGSFAKSKITLNGEIKGAGFLGIRTNTISNSGMTKQLTFFNKTKDLLDSSHSTKWAEMRNATLKDYAESMCGALGYNVTVSVDTGKPFPVIQSPTGLTYAQVLQNLASNRGFFIGGFADEKANPEIIIRKLPRPGEPVADLKYGGDNVPNWQITIDDTKRFRVYGTYAQSGDGNYIYDKAEDETVPNIIREITVNAGNVDKDNAKTAAAWLMIKIHIQSQEIKIPVTDWIDNTGKIWLPGDTVTLTAPIFDIMEARKYIIRTVDFNWDAKSRAATLHLIPAIDVKGGKIIFY